MFLLLVMRFLYMIAVFYVLNFQQAVAKDISPRKILKLIVSSKVLDQHFTGFALYDLKSKKMIAEHNAWKYFTPASNTKLLTFYAGLKFLKDSIAGLQFVEKGDSLIFWGTGDPTFLHPDFLKQPVKDKLISTRRMLYWAAERYTSPFYGTGWTYDDYNEYYQPEISELPIYGNTISFKSIGNQMVTYPEISDASPFRLIQKSEMKTASFKAVRNILTNEFYIPTVQAPTNFSQIVPFKTTIPVVSQLLKSNFPNFAGVINFNQPAIYQSWYSIPADSLYRSMLLPSDNFIAEQILLNIAATNGLEMNTAKLIDYIKRSLFQEMPDKPLWVDCSGLSRQNLFTPRSLIWLCEKIYNETADEKRLFNLLPNGGKTGTLKGVYKADQPFVFAKTGSLSNNHNQTGFLITKDGRKLIYSFMNNNFTIPSAEIRNEMERIVTLIHQNY